MTTNDLHIGERVILADQRVGILRSITHTLEGVIVEIEQRHVLKFDHTIGTITGNPDELGVKHL